MQALGEGVTVQACAYGERKSGKQYRFWLSEGTARDFTPIRPDDEESLCPECKAVPPRLHTQAQITSKRQRLSGTVTRVRLPGKTVAAANNRVPPNLAEHLAWAMRAARATARAAEQAQR
jgi:hypothetical protein